MKISDQTRFWRGVTKGPKCWLWNRATNNKGYGVIGINRKLELAHRMAWRFRRGEIPPGISVLHRCDVPRCVRPSHLFLGTQTTNMGDCVAKGRLHTGHLYECKLTDRKVVVLRARYARGETITSLSAAYGVCLSRVHAIVNRTAWRHVTK